MHGPDPIAGVILGTALGDATGLPFEGLSRRRIARRLRGRALAPWGAGWVSDDTEHTALVARALVTSGGDPDQFARALGRSLRRWLWSLPPGVGWGTLRSLIKLSLGWSPARSGVASAGNGPAMRAALLGVTAIDDAHLARLVAISTRVTHVDPRAEDAALAVARAARAASAATSSAALVADLAAGCRTEPLRRALDVVAGALAAGRHPGAELGWQRGVSGYCIDTVAAALWTWGAHRGDARAAIEAAVRLGGDTDSVAAITGGLAGADGGVGALPAGWLARLTDWPLDRRHLEQLAAALGGAPLPADRTLLALPRNLAAAVIFGLHAMRRLTW